MITVFVVMDIDLAIDSEYKPVKVFANDIEAQAECRYLDPDGVKQTYIEEVEYHV